MKRRSERAKDGGLKACDGCQCRVGQQRLFTVAGKSLCKDCCDKAVKAWNEMAREADETFCKEVG